MRLFSQATLPAGARQDGTLSLPQVFLILSLISAAYESLIRHTSIADCLWLVPGNATLYSGMFVAMCRLDLLRLSLGFLALPYFFFFAGWLNTPAALTSTLILAGCVHQVWQATTRTSTAASAVPATTTLLNLRVPGNELAAFVMLLAWVNLCGAGGYGYQTFDYSIQNARLLDLVNYEWPVRYGKDLNFVYYFGYFLPAAALGKLLGADVAIRSMYPWTVAGICIAFRWLAHHSQWRPGLLLASLFILFGPLDVIGLAYLYLTTDNITPSFAWKVLRDNTDTLDFWTAFHAGFFIGNFLSNTFQLYWSPPQIIAGWICAGTVMHLIKQSNVRQLAFVFSLLALWAPLVMIALFPVVAGALLLALRRNWRDVLTVANTAGSGTLVILFLLFYASGSMQKNDSFWLFTAGSVPELLLLLLASWGVYGLTIYCHLPRLPQPERLCAILLTVAVALLTVRTYGPFNDLLCRGSAPLMFMTLCLLLYIAQQYRNAGNRLASGGIFVLLLPGFLSAILQMETAIRDYGHLEPPLSIATLAAPNLNVGDDESFFRRYLARRSIREQ